GGSADGSENDGGSAGLAAGSVDSGVASGSSTERSQPATSESEALSLFLVVARLQMGLVIGMNVGFLQPKSNSFDEVLTRIEIFMFFIGLMSYILRHVIFSSTCSPRQTRDVVPWILYWIPNTCAPLVAIPMISFCISIGGAAKITILIIGYIVLVATNFSQLRSDAMRLFLHPVDRTKNVIDRDYDKACAVETQNAAAKGKDQIWKGHLPVQANGVKLMLHV
ncbi:hypothetical protein Droror1_Dr00008860, partial [Drosera rotundifolia]